ncbi:MAG: hypothetical protein U0325_02845 [Polyangiales bacterium]
MNPVLQRESLLALDDLRDALSRIDTAAWRDELAGAVRARVETARERLRSIAATAEASSDMGAARERVNALLATLDALPSPRESALTAWTSFRASASQRMDSLSDSLRELSAARARPSNLARSFFHAASGLAAVAAIALLHDRRWLIAIALPWACFAWTSELLRRRYRGANLRLMRVLGPIAHPHEWHRVNSATWFVTALLLLAMFAPLRSAALGCAVLALGDPAAALVGRRWGRVKIAQNRTLEGALAFVAVGTVVSLAVTLLVPGAPASALALAATAGVVGALTELYSGRVDDNLSIPVVTAVAVTLVERLGR